MDIFYKFATDTDAEVNGVERKLDDTTTLLIARQGNPKASRLWAEISEQRREALSSPDVETREAAEVERVVDVLSQAILVGWSGVQFQGKELPYSVENARTLLRIGDFRTLVIGLSSDAEAYRVKQAGEAAKN